MKKGRLASGIAILIAFPLIIWGIITFVANISRAAPQKANIHINARNITGPLPFTWKALAQGGEEQGVRMLENVVSQVSVLSPRYIRLDHIYDFYNVVTRNPDNSLNFYWDELDETVCDIYRTGARPFFSLGYMPPTMSDDGTLIGKPKDWNEWSFLVQKTVEHYSGKATRICGQVTGEWMNNIYYEVWNEPDLESFGKWSKYNGSKDYKQLYYYSVRGAENAQNVYPYHIGGPVTAAAYKNWFQLFLDSVTANNLRLDFLSWHHYSKNTNDYTNDMLNLDQWLSPSRYAKYRSLPRIISEWGYNSDPDPIAETNVGAAHTISAIRNLIEQKLEMAFAFDIKDGPEPRWGILTHEGEKKPRYKALFMLNVLSKYRLALDGEGTYVQALATTNNSKISVVIVNYDRSNTNTELVPLTIRDLDNGSYILIINRLTQQNPEETIVPVQNNVFFKQILMGPNEVISVELSPLL